MKISAICFDLGKVLLDFDKEAMLRRVAEKSPLTPAEITALAANDPQGLAYERGDLSTAEFIAHWKKLLRYEGTSEELQAAYSEIFTPLVENIAIAEALAPHYPLAIISNTNDAHILHAEATYPLFQHFPVRIYSHQVRAMKPDGAIYEAALAAMGGGIDPREALFIDDLESNVQGAVRLGWQTIHLRPGVDLRQELIALGVEGL